MRKPSNPNAFPIALKDNNNPFNSDAKGMTLRDYFAAKAISNVEIVSINQGWETQIARRAYLLADEMLKQREL